MGRPGTSRPPAPYPLPVTRIAGTGPYRQPAARSSAAPVGVTVSPAVGVPVTCAPSSNATVAGAGAGKWPCRISITPDPSASGADQTAVTRSACSAAATPTVSTIVSTPPSSCRCTPAAGTPWIRPSASARAVIAAAASSPAAAGAAARASVSRSAAGRAGTSSSTWTRAWQAVSPARRTGAAVSSQPVIPVLATAARTASSGAPRSSSAPSSMSPEIPENGFSHKITARSPLPAARAGRRRRLAAQREGQPVRGHRGAEPGVDVDHADAGRAGGHHGQQRGDAVQRRAVPG